MTMKANAQPPPLFLPGSAFFPSSADWGHFDDTSSVDSMSTMSTISTTFEAADDMQAFAASFDQTVVVYLFDPQQRDFSGCNTLQPHHGDGVDQKTIDTINDINLLVSQGVTPQTALLLMSQLEQYNHDEIEKKNIIPSSKELIPWQGNHYSYDSLSNMIAALFTQYAAAKDDDDDAPLPTFLVQPREGFLLPPDAKRARVTPMSIPPLYIKVPNPLDHHDD